MLLVFNLRGGTEMSMLLVYVTGKEVAEDSNTYDPIHTLPSTHSLTDSLCTDTHLSPSTYHPSHP